MYTTMIQSSWYQLVMRHSVETSTGISQNIIQLDLGSVHGPLASLAVVHIVGWRLSSCNLQPVHHNPANQCSTPSIPSRNPLSHNILFIRPLKIPNIGIETTSNHYPSARTKDIIRNQLQYEKKSYMLSISEASSHDVGKYTDNMENFKAQMEKFNKHTREE